MGLALLPVAQCRFLMATQGSCPNGSLFWMEYLPLWAQRIVLKPYASSVGPVCVCYTVLGPHTGGLRSGLLGVCTCAQLVCLEMLFPKCL